MSSIIITNGAKKNLIMIDWKQQRMQSYINHEIQLQSICLQVMISILNFYHYSLWVIYFSIEWWEIQVQKQKKYYIYLWKITAIDRYANRIQTLPQMDDECFTSERARSYQFFKFSSIFFFWNDIPLSIIRNWMRRKYYCAFTHTHKNKYTNHFWMLGGKQISFFYSTIDLFFFF